MRTRSLHPAHTPILLRCAGIGLLVWAVVHAAVEAGVRVSGAGDIYSFVRVGVLALTALAVGVDLRSSGRIVFHANLGLDGRLLMTAALAPGTIGEVVLHALQVAVG